MCCLHSDVLNINSNSKKFYLWIFKIRGGIPSLTLHCCVLGYLCSQRQLTSVTVLLCHPSNSEQRYQQKKKNTSQAL